MVTEDKTVEDNTPVWPITKSQYWQICPKCNASGRAFNYANLIPCTMDICDVCNGKKIISTITGKPPGE